MTELYNCKHAGDQYRMTKFDEDMNPLHSYLVTLDECDCPAGQRETCRHRQMLPAFIELNRVGADWFYDYERGGWVQTLTDALSELAKIPGVTIVDLGNPEEVYNAIAEAVGEPTTDRPSPRPSTLNIRRRV